MPRPGRASSRRERLARSPALLLLALLLPRASLALGSFRELAPLPFARSDHTATAMPDGLIYLIGGCDGAQTCDASGGRASSFCKCTSFTRNVAVYDAARDDYLNASAAPPPMSVPRYRHLACAVRDLIVVFGGRDLATDALITQVDAFNVTSRLWLPTGQLAPYPAGLGSDNSCSTVGDLIYVFGGYTQNYSVTLASAFSFAPLSGPAGVWTQLPASLLKGRGDFASVATADGKVHIYGGYAVPDFCSPLALHEVFDPAAMTFTAAPPLPAGLAEKDDGVDLGGVLLSIGGETKSVATGCGDIDITPLRSFYAFSGANWTSIATLPDARMRFASAELGGTVYTFGGQGELVDAGSDFPFLPILYSAFSFTLNNAPAAPPAPAPAAAPSFSAGDVAGAAIGSALLALMLNASLGRWRQRTSGSDATRTHRLPLS